MSVALFISLVVGVLFAASIYLILGRELKEVCMGFFLLSHAANLAIIEAGRKGIGRFAPVLGEGHTTDELVDPLPQALILTAIVIGFAVQGFLLTLLVITWRRSRTLDTDALGAPTEPDEISTPPAATAAGGSAAHA